MSTSPVPSAKPAAPRKGSGRLLSLLGVVIVAAILILLNVFFSYSNAGLDFTANKVHTLSDGTKSILGRLDTDVSIKFFVTHPDQLHAQLRPMVEETESWLARYRELKPEFVKVEKFNVETASDEEDEAARAGVDPQQGMYFGIAVTCLDRTAVIPFVPQVLSQDRIEYSLSAAITEVMRSKKKTVGLMTALPVTGNAMPFGGAGQPAWGVYQMLKDQYEVKNIEVTASSIEPGIDVLVLIHPAGITDEAQWAVDQYLLKGGRVIAFLDSYSFIAAQSRGQQNPMGGGGGGTPTSSSLPKLLGAWGYSYDDSQVVADMGYSTSFGGGASSPLLLTLGKDAISQDSDITKQLNNFWLVFSGTFTGSPATGISEKVLLKTSPKQQMVSTSYATANPSSPAGQQQLQRLTSTFKPEGKERILAVQLTGRFKTGFPEGKPAAPPPAPPGGGGPGGLPPGLNFGGPQGEEGQAGAQAEPAATPAAAAPATPAPAAEAPAAPAEVQPAAEAVTAPIPLAPAPTPAAPSVSVPAIPANPADAVPAEVTVTPGAPVPVDPAKPATDAAKPESLKESTADGIVYLVADSDMLADVLSPMIQETGNIPLALNMVDQASGDKDLMAVRSRASSRRPFSRLNEIAEAANDKIRADVESMNGELNKLNEEISSKQTAKDRNTAIFKGLQDMQRKQKEISIKIREKQKIAKKEIKANEDLIKWVNILPVPLFLIALLIVVMVIRNAKTSAR